MESPSAYIPLDRRLALLGQNEVADHSTGTVLFADVSDFTALTELFFKELGPKRGVEQLTLQLNAIYGTLIDSVAAWHGSVVGFSGDALTCWFDGDNGHRAACCALLIQQAMTEWATITITEQQVAAFAIKIALAYGPVRRFVVGDAKIQYLDTLAGATLQRVMQAEHQASRGEIVVSREIIENLGFAATIAGWRTPDLAILTDVAPGLPLAPWPQLDQALPSELTQPWLLPLVYQHIVAGQSQFLAEIRPLVALFMRFDGIDYDQDAAAQAKLNALTQHVQHTLAQVEGTLLHLVVGDKGQYFYAIFGAPLAHEDDALRAVRAALALQTLPSTFPDVTAVHIGISKGRMLVGSYGNNTYRTYSALGDEVNVAARLMMHAESGQILISHHVAEATAAAYTCTPLAAITIKGKQEPLPVALVDGPRYSSLPLFDRQTTPGLIGRETELAQIVPLLERGCAGEGQIIVLEGDAGVGKSHLAMTVLDLAAALGARTVFSACQSADQQSSYAPWRQMLRSLFGLDAAHPAPDSPRKQRRQHIRRLMNTVHKLHPAWRERVPLLSDVLELAIPDNATTAGFEARVRQEALFNFITDVLHTWTEVQPLLLVLEDAHWLDEASLGLLLALSQRLSATPLLLLLTQRPPDQGVNAPLAVLADLAYCTSVPIRELPPTGVLALITQHLNGSPPQLLVDIIQARTQGNPFFIEELLATLRESGRLFLASNGMWQIAESMIQVLHEADCVAWVQGDWTLLPDAPLGTVYLGLPDSVRGVVLSRIDRLPEDQRLTLKVASTIGRIFAFDVLRQSHPLQFDAGRLREQLRLLEMHNFTITELPGPHLSYIFKHTLIQEVAYETLLESQQQELHQAVATTMQRLHPEAVEQLAYHFSRSGQRDQALWYLELAARKAQRAYANETALAYYTRALAFEERWQWRKGQIEILHLLGRRPEEFAALRALPDDPAVPLAEVAFQCGLYYEATSDYVQAQMYMQRALEAYREQGQRIGEMLTLRRLGAITRSLGQHEVAKQWYQTGLAVFQYQHLRLEEEKYALAQLLIGLGTIHRQQSEFAEAHECYMRALNINQEIGNRYGEAEALNGLGGSAYYQRHYAEAQTYWEQTRAIYQLLGDRVQQGISLYNLGLVFQEIGDYSQAEQYLHNALEIQQRVGNRWEEANIWNILGTLHQQMGDVAQAEACLQRSLATQRSIGDTSGQAYTLSNLGVLYCDCGNMPQAEMQLLAGLALARNQLDHLLEAHCLSHLGIVYQHMNEPAKAIQYSQQALHIRTNLQLAIWTTTDFATLALAHMRLGQLTEAVEYASQSITLLDSFQNEGLEAPHQDFFACFQVFQQVGDEQRALDALQKSYDLVQQYAVKIPAIENRTRFLDYFPLHRAIVQHYQDLSSKNTAPTSRVL